ncbi:MAG: hypothetical protein U0360_02400 [Dehalococcoidia bacterium]
MLARIEIALTLLGATLGLLGVGWGATLAEPPSVAWLAIAMAIGALPYLLALFAIGAVRGRSAARAWTLGAATVLSAGLAFVTGFSIGAAFLPPTVLLAGATTTAIARGMRSRAVAGA